MTVGHLLEKSINKMQPHKGFFLVTAHLKPWGLQEPPPPVTVRIKKIDRSNGRLKIVPTWSKLGPKGSQKLDTP